MFAVCTELETLCVFNGLFVGGCYRDMIICSSSTALETSVLGRQLGNKVGFCVNVRTCMCNVKMQWAMRFC